MLSKSQFERKRTQYSPPPTAWVCENDYSQTEIRTDTSTS